jgi:phosphoribosylformimino-5-aminoimidazole carboxamide ribotide isomerase
MIIYPAIDLINGQCVRLHKGDFDQQTTYNASPIETAQSYKDQGADWLHLVDLDGARDPSARQTDVIRDIIQSTQLKVQTGGGVRSLDDVQTLVDAGASRVVIGSLAVKSPETVMQAFERFGAYAICLAVDVIPKADDFMVAVSGWQEESTMSINALIDQYKGVGLKHVLCTDIDRDGTMQGCNLELYAHLQTRYPDLVVQASGGVRDLNDIRALNTAGVIIGKALYENVFSVADAIEAASC